MSETVLDLIQKVGMEIRRDSEDLARLKQRYPGFDFVRIPVNEAKSIRVETTPASPKAELSFLQATILALFISSPEREWTSRNVLGELTTHGQVSFPSDEAGMNAVGLSLIALAEGGQITRTHEGRGRDPHRYKTIAKIKNEEPAEAGS